MKKNYSLKILWSEAVRLSEVTQLIQKPPMTKCKSQIEVVTNWQHTDEASPAFKRLMMLLLRERIGNGEKATERESNRPNYQVL